MKTLADVRFVLVGGGPMDGATVTKPKLSPPPQVLFQIGDRLAVYVFDNDRRRYAYLKSKKNCAEEINSVCDHCDGVVIQTQSGEFCIDPKCGKRK